MGVIILLFVIFIVTVLIILIFPPSAMSEEEDFKASVKQLWGIAKICQTASFGMPSLLLTPARRSVTLDLHFLDEDTVSMAMPLTLKKQQKAKAKYLALFEDHGLKAITLEKKLIVHLDRKDPELGQLIAHLYRALFDASDADTVKFKVKTLTSDIRILRHFGSPDYKWNEDYAFNAPSSRHKGKSLLRVQTARILGAVYFLLFPPLIILSYKAWGLMGMCWAALIFFGFFAVYNSIYKKTSILESLVRGSLLYCVLLSATLATQNIAFLQAIPSIIGLSTAIISAALLFNIWQPKSKGPISQKTHEPHLFRFTQSVGLIIGVALFLVNEWAWRSFTLDKWVWFLALFRIEFMMASMVVFAPIFAVYYTLQENRKDDAETKKTDSG